ncbi:two pore domain potassium channel family protein [Roseomonas terrae]|uniref:Two pore domain potassium channel family protein n=1 Tax=Neoroseomonas terrae TaxID=424799 RepID=A0ABS5EHE8_9PROT|nr:ion channel [Neoroseomonas terrae]MBR0650390.1 two pore domain potassium channel family protein [Neoroseomonas terrae]
MVFHLGVGFMAMILSMAIHFVATIFIVSSVRKVHHVLIKSPYIFIFLVLVLINTVLFITHLTGVSIWASLYVYLGAVDNFADAFYSSFIMNTTLGLGDIAQDAGTRLLAPLTATSGIMMIGWSTAVFVYVIQTYLPHIARSE